MLGKARARGQRQDPPIVSTRPGPPPHLSGETSICPVSRWRRWSHWLLFLLVLALSVLPRVHDLGTWRDNQHLYFFENEPLLQNFDGYYYLRFAQNLRDGKYRPVDELRRAPEPPPRPYPPPLLSYVTVLFSTVTTLSLDWAAALLPVLLSLSLAPLMFILCRQFQISTLPSAIAALVCMTSQTYVDRTSLGFYDTDSLIVPFSVGASILALGFALHLSPQRYLYLLGAAANAAVFAWWWDQAPEAVAMICIMPLLFSAALYYRPRRREGLLVCTAVIASFLAFLVAVPEAVRDASRNILEVTTFGARGASEYFPAVAGDIDELRAVNWRQLIDGTIGFAASLTLGLVGLLWLAWTHPRRTAVALTVPVMLALSVFLFGYRAMIFWGPPLGLALAFLIDAMDKRFEQHRPWLGAAAAAVVVAIAVLPNVVKEMRTPSTAPRTKNLIQAVPSIRERTPENAIIWTSWTAGYPLMYFTGRRVIADGEFMSGERRVYIYLPLASRDPNFSRNFIRFYAARGTRGLRQIDELAGPGLGLRWARRELGRTPEEAALSLLELSPKAESARACASVATCREFLFPSRTDPIYLLLNHEIFAGRWFWYGTWDTVEKQGESSAIKRLFHIRHKGDTIHVSEDLEFDVNKGRRLQLVGDGKSFTRELGRLMTYTGSALATWDYDHEGGFHLEWMRQNGFGAIMTPNVADTFFNKLLIRHTTNPAYFRPTALSSPYYSIWEVVPNP